jgi:hypothetical protein
MLVLYYNRDLFDAYGVPYPESGWTWDDFLDKAKALRDPEASVFGYGVADQYIDPLPFIYQHGGRILDDMQNPTRTTFDDPLTVEAVEWYAGLILDHNVAPTRNQVLGSPFNGSVQAGVYLNKVGMWIGWLSERGEEEGHRRRGRHRPRVYGKRGAALPRAVRVRETLYIRKRNRGDRQWALHASRGVERGPATSSRKIAP